MCRLAASYLVLIPLVTLGAVPVHAQETPDTAYIAAADGTPLRILLYRPTGDGPFPVVIVRSPYTGQRGSGMAWLASRLVPAGYAMVEQDVRGAGGSGGAFVPFVHDIEDGGTTLAWVAEQPWAGRIGLWGVSYSGWAAYAAASSGGVRPHAMVVGSGYGDLAEFLSPGGAFQLQAHVTWMIGFGPQGGGRLPPAEALEQVFRTAPLNALLGGQEAVAAFAERPLDWSMVDVPTLHWTGWFDYIYRDALTGYARLREPDRRHRDDQRLIIGPWSHNGELSGSTRVGPVDFGHAAVAGLDSVAAWSIRFFDQHLKQATAPTGGATVFFMGENRWRSFEHWPAPSARTTTWYPYADGTLTDRPPGDPGDVAFRYDPNDPVPTIGGVLSHFFPQNLGPLSQDALDGRDDIVRFMSPVLEHDLVLAGPMRAVVSVCVDAPSTDLTAKLVALAPDGSSAIIEDGIRRIPRLRGCPDDVVIELGQRALRLPAGHRLRLDVSGGNFPKFDRNPNTGEDPMAAAAFAPVGITVRTGSGTRLELMVLDP